MEKKGKSLNFFFKKKLFQISIVTLTIYLKFVYEDIFISC